jgi:hypothetical protein
MTHSCGWNAVEQDAGRPAADLVSNADLGELPLNRRDHAASPNPARERRRVKLEKEKSMGQLRRKRIGGFRGEFTYERIYRKRQARPPACDSRTIYYVTRNS